MAEIQTYLYGKKFPNRIFVGGLPVNTKASELADFFKYFGHVTETKIILDDSGISKGYGFVTFATKESVEKVDSMGILYFKNKKINIGPAVKKDITNIPPEIVVFPAQMPSYPTYYSMQQQQQQQQQTQYQYQQYYQAPMYYNPYYIGQNNNSYPKEERKIRRVKNLPPRFLRG